MSDRNRAVGWWFPFLLVLLLLAIVVTRGWLLREIPSGDGDIPTAGPSADATVSLVVDFGDGRRQQYDTLPYHDGMTVAQLLMVAGRQQDPGLTFLQRGTGAAAFLTEIDGVANEGATGRNWQYWVNGDHANASFAVHSLRPGDQVLWKFASSE